MILISGTIDFDPAKRDDAVTAVKELMEATRAEDGCLRYVFSADVDDPGRFHIIEHWETLAANEAHATTPHLAAFMGMLGELGIRGAELRRWESDEGIALL